MGIILDIVLVAFIMLNIVIGYKRGLIGVIFSILAFLISVAITFVLFKPVSNYVIENFEIDNTIKQIILRNNVNNPEENEEESNSLQGYIMNNIKDAQNQAKEQVIEVVAENVSKKAVEVISAIAIFAVARIIVGILKFFLEKIASVPLIKQFNKIGGVAYGIAKSVIIIYVFLTILFIVVSINSNGIIANMIETSYVTKVLYSNNIIVKYCLLDKNLL